jgi:NTE family protein
VDGSITAPVPTEAALEAGAEVVVAVNVCSPVDRTDVLVQTWKWWKEMPARPRRHLPGVPGFWRFLKPVLPDSVNIIGRSLDLYDRYVNTSPQVTPSMHYWLLRPAVEDVKWYEFHRVRECIQAGEAVGRQVAEQVSGFLQARDCTEGIAHEPGQEREIVGGRNEGR